jgi:GTP pyrophosphokinase
MKMRKRNKTADEIFDLAGIRIICDSIENCYTLLGVVHRLGKPGNGTFRDYIARPKPNGYQSLHTTIMFYEGADAEHESKDGKLLEIQIRTAQMHQIAEHGIASHWLYKKGSSRNAALPEEINIANRLKDWSQGSQGTSDFSPVWLEDIKKEILRKKIYVFTPQGKVISLPAGGTPVDFAYQIHTTIGERCVGAKANGHIIPLRSQLENTQVVEILTSTSAHPHISWLETVKSSKARSKIRWWINKNDEFFSAEKAAEAKKKAASETLKQQISETASRMRDPSPVQQPVQPLTSVLRVRIGEEKNMMVRFARCCNPAPNGPITGYVSRGRGIIIHRVNCVNLANNPEVENRRIAAEWEVSEPPPVTASGKRPRLT